MVESGALGKKVFFLYPPPVLGEVVEELARQEFEVYLVRDHAKLLRILHKDTSSILFINLDEGMSEPEWAAYVSGLAAEEATKSIGVGVLSLLEDRELMQKYLMDLQVSCGFVVVKIGVAKTTEILLKTLEANEARGRRKFVRAVCQPGTAQAVVEVDGRQLRAELADISCAGVAMHFTETTNFKVGTVLKRLQLTVKGSNIVVDGFVAARRNEGENPDHIVMFAPSSLDDQKKDKIRTIVSKINQTAMDRLIATI